MINPHSDDTICRTSFSSLWRWYTSILFLICHVSTGQSLISSQYYFAPANINPAYAGLEKDLFFGLNHRSQWRNLQIPYNATTFSASYPFYVAKPKAVQVGGIACAVSQENAGVANMYSSLQGQFSAAYNLRLDSHKNLLVLGLQGNIIQNSVNPESLQWGSQYNAIQGYDPTIVPSLGLLTSRVAYPAFSAGLIWHHVVRENFKRKKYMSHMGLSVANLNQPNTSFFSDHPRPAELILKTSSSISYTVQEWQISHNLLWVQSSEVYHINFGTYVTYLLTNRYNTGLSSVKLSMGSWYRWRDAVVLSAALQSSQLGVALSYDFNRTFLERDIPAGGAYELSVSYRISRKEAFNRQYGIPLM